MKAIDVAYVFIRSYGSSIKPTNLKLNKLVYFAQVESLRQRGRTLFDDEIEAWQYGPVVPAIYQAFKRFGSGIVLSAPLVHYVDESDMGIIDYVATTYGTMTAFDLVSLSHRDGGAWKNAYSRYVDNVISDRDIIESIDFKGIDGISGALGNGIRGVMDSIPNALKMLEDS